MTEGLSALSALRPSRRVEENMTRHLFCVRMRAVFGQACFTAAVWPTQLKQHILLLNLTNKVLGNNQIKNEQLNRPGKEHLVVVFFLGQELNLQDAQNNVRS